MNKLVKLATIPIIFFLALAYSPGFFDISPVYFPFLPPRPFTGPLEPNDHLNKATKLLVHSIAGPESIAIYQGALYTGLMNGWIVRITDDNIIEPIATIANGGRVCGLRITKNGTLIAADIVHGLYEVNIKTGAVKSFHRVSQEVNGKKSKMVNDFDIAFKSGDIYFSESSNKYGVSEAIYEFLENAPNGRILHHNIYTNTTRVLVDDLALPNGVQLSPKKDYLLFSELLRRRIMKYHLKGKYEGKLEVFIDNLPGYPDNIRSNGQGGYWVALFKVTVPGKGDSLLSIGPNTMVRKVLARIIYLTQSFLNCIDYYCPSLLVKTLASMLTDIRFYMPLDANYGMILEFNENGEILRSLHSPDGYLSDLSEVAVYGDVLYLGSAFNPYLAKLSTNVKSV